MISVFVPSIRQRKGINLKDVREDISLRGHYLELFSE